MTLTLSPRTRRLVIVAPIALILAYLSTVASIASVARFSNPSLALRLMPFDAGANAAQADRMMQLGGSGTGRADAAALARRSLERSLLSPTALRVLGFAAEADQKRQRARRLIQSAAKLSRRDLATNLWLIDDAVARDDVPAALDGFDTAMRTSMLSRDILFPILSSAIADEAYIDPVVGIFKRKPNWLHAFILLSLRGGSSTENLAVIIARSKGSIPRVDPSLEQLALERLIFEQKYLTAQRFYQAMAKQRGGRSGADQLVRNGNFRTDPVWIPFDWQYVESSARGIERGDNGIAIYADPGGEGVIATQLMTLKPGSYRLTTIGNSRSSDRLAGADWIVTCAAPGNARLATLQLPRVLRSEPLTADFTVPSDSCSGQWLQLSVRPSQAPDGVSGTVRGVSLEHIPG